MSRARASLPPRLPAPRPGEGDLHRCHRRLGHQLHASQRRLWTEIPSRDNGLRSGLSGLRRGRPAGPLLRERRRLALAPAQGESPRTLPQSGRRNFRGRHRPRRPRRRELWDRRGRSRLRWRRPRGPVRERAWARPPVPQSGGRDLRGRHRPRRGLGPGVRLFRHVAGLRPRRMAGSVRLQLRAMDRERRHLLHPGRGEQILLHSGVLSRRHQPPLPQSP